MLSWGFIHDSLNYYIYKYERSLLFYSFEFHMPKNFDNYFVELLING